MPDSADSSARRILFNRLQSLPTAQLNHVIYTLSVPAGIMPDTTAAPGLRVSALLDWADSPTGCGSDRVAQVLEAVLAKPLYGLPDTKPEAVRRDRNETILIDAVWTEVEDRLRQSLHNAILMRLDMVEQRHQVSRPWDSQLRTADEKPKTLAPGTPIATVFDRREVGGKLLILGHPGSGKTTTLLDLAAVLIQRANEQPDQPIPVMVNLSSWQDPKQSITDWLLSELKLKYGVSPKLGQTWLQQKTLLPLLDGLDELPPQRQEPVVNAINGWLQSGEGPTGLLVCSRLEEYELYAAKLALNGAIRLQPLTDTQLQDYLTSLEMAALWETLQQDEELLALVRTPLLLSVSILANDHVEPAAWRRQQTTQARMTYLLDAYVERQLHAKVKSQYPPGKQPTAGQTRRWLVWMARQLQAQSEDEFLIERLQPALLTTRQQRLILWLIGGLIYGLIVGLIYGLINGLIVGLIVGLIAGQSSIDTVESFDLSFSRFARKEFLRQLIGGLIVGLIFGLIFGLILWLIGGLIVGLINGLIFGLIGGLKTDIKAQVEPNQGIWSSLKNTGLLLVVSIPVALALRVALPPLLASSVEADGIEFIVAMASAMTVWTSICNSSMACTAHFALRVALFRARAVPWNYARFLNHCTDRLLLQRVGGRYRFIHKLVQEHFAAMPVEGVDGWMGGWVDGWMGGWVDGV